VWLHAHGVPRSHARIASVSALRVAVATRARGRRNRLLRVMLTRHATYTIRLLVCPLSPYSQTSPHNSKTDPRYVHMHIATFACHRAHRKSHAPRSRFLRRQPRAESVTPSHAACSQRHDGAQEHAQTRRTSRTRSVASPDRPTWTASFLEGLTGSLNMLQRHRAYVFCFGKGDQSIIKAIQKRRSIPP